MGSMCGRADGKDEKDTGSGPLWIQLCGGLLPDSQAGTGRSPFPNMVVWTGQEVGGTERKREREGERAA